MDEPNSEQFFEAEFERIRYREDDLAGNAAPAVLGGVMCFAGGVVLELGKSDLGAVGVGAGALLLLCGGVATIKDYVQHRSNVRTIRGLE